MLDPGLEVAPAGLDDGTGLEAIGGEPGELGFIEVVQHRVAVLAGGPEIDVRATGIAELEPLELATKLGLDKVANESTIRELGKETAINDVAQDIKETLPSID